MLNALSIDLEDEHCAFARDWLHIDIEPSDAVVKNTECFLEIFAQYNVNATFFILGEVAQKFPSLIKRIAESGHEIAVHGFYHKQIFKLTQEQFRREVTDCKKLLEDITSYSVVGHRAPAFSIMPHTHWALEVLSQEGFKYDSSIYPISGKRYGWPGFSKGICRLNLSRGLSIIEVPMSTITIFGKALPVAGGGYIRHFPYYITKKAIERIQKTRPAVIYMHPYEIDTEKWLFRPEHLSPKDWKTAVKLNKRQFRNRQTVREKLIKLCSEFELTTITRVIEETYNE
jgi:polysaccharide deacetylase family protein (PEP-CTERM system associated)